MMIFATAATAVLLTCFALEIDWPLLGSVAASGGGGGRGGHETYADEPRDYDSDRGDGEDDYKDGDDVDGGNGGLQQQEHEDQLDQDDPVSTVKVTAVRGSIALLPCDIGGGDNEGLPKQSQKSVTTGSGGEGGKSKDLTNTVEDRAYMVLWFKHHQQHSTIRHRNSKSKNKKMSSGGKPLYSFDVRGRPLAHALKWSSDEDYGGFGPRATFVVLGNSDGRGRWSKQHHHPSPEEYASGDPYDNSSRAALKVTNVTEQDAGAYRCRVDFRDSPTKNYRIILRVIVPPDKMTIAYNGGTEIEGGTHHVVGPVPEGSQLVLVCKVQGGKPKPRVQWYSANGKITSSLSMRVMDLTEEGSYSGNSNDEETTTKRLVINQLSRSHANSTYTCLAGNDDNTMEFNLRMTVVINMYLNVQSVRIVDIRQIDESENTVNYNEESNNSGGVQGTNLISGKWYTGECLADGASPRATIEWSIDGNGTLADEIPSSPMTTRITVIEKTEHSSRIRFRPIPGDDGRYLRCRAWNPDINTTKDDIKNKALLLYVQYPPIVKLSLGHTFDPSRIKTGDDVYFECKVLNGGGEKGKQRNRIEWYHNGHPILQNGSSNSSISINSDIKVVLLSAGTLVIRNVGRRHSGRYTCQCSNDLGMGRSRPVTLRVQFAPVCADDGNQRQLVGVEKNEKNVRIVCRVKADPADERVQFEWLVWPGVAEATELHQQQSPSVVATGNYVTTAMSGSPNDTATGLVIGVLELPAMTVGVADVVQYVDRAANVRKPIVLDTVSCRATNAVGRQQNPCLYHIVPASSPGALTSCTIRLPKDQERRFGYGNRHYHRRTPSTTNNAEDMDIATVTCDFDNDGGVRPVIYSLEIYESNVLTTTFHGSTEETADNYRNKYRSEWLVDNITGTANGNSIEYRVNRKNLQLRIGPNENKKYLSLSAYAANRMGRSLQTYLGSDNAILLSHPWWWHGESSNESSTKGPVGTSSTEWWIMLSGSDDRQSKSVNGGSGGGSGNGATASIVIALTVMIVTIVGVTLILLWKRQGGRSVSSTSATETAIVTNLIAPNNHHRTACDDKTGKKYSLLSQQQQQQQQVQQRGNNIYPNLNASNGDDYDDDDYDYGNDRTTVAATVAPDIMIQQTYGKQFLASITNRGIPGPESCV
ncbi:uncharacterized protein LOC112692984 [Sipha flava]|uniref:Uncharacterized protein LOC112692984 n=1 Tax=Sipha flava TaxID=143950 RepID=A0A8B8GM01_9HEMI|nr:uncharacterized protein LOC112692984 [Sipha flava]XP_025423616.1 uncharacterized protein LOC112692984 [Sipha flava]